MLNLNYSTMTKPEFSKFLENYYLDWQKKNGRSSIRKFSRWLGVHYSLVDQWMNGKGNPGEKNMAKLALKLGPEVYDIFDKPRPPLFIQKLEAIYDDLNDDQRKYLLTRIKEILDEDYLTTKE